MGRDKMGAITIPPSKSLSREDNRKAADLAIVARRREVVRRYLEGWSQVKIAEAVGVSQFTISEDIKAIHQGWEASAILDWDKLKTKEAEEITHRIEVLWAAWERSCELEEVRTTGSKRERQAVSEGKGKDKKVTGHEMVVVERSSQLKSKKLLGDPRYMAEITKCQELRLRLFGLLKDDPKQQVNSSQTNVFVLLEEAVKQRVDPIEVRLKEEEDKAKQLASTPVGEGGEPSP